MTTKFCNRCKLDLPASAFYVVQKRNKPILWHMCKSCCKLARSKPYQRNWELQKKYGISLEEYELNCQTRNNKCDICSTETKTLHVDHCHTTSKVRGFLCGSCNRALGLFKDSSTILSNAQKYLEEYNGNTLSNSRLSG
jgi:protein-arginine kinase activator protein McsA